MNVCSPSCPKPKPVVYRETQNNVSVMREIRDLATKANDSRQTHLANRGKDSAPITYGVKGSYGADSSI